MKKTKNQNTQQKVPQLRFPGFTGEWEEKKLGEIAEIIGGGTPDTNKKEYWNGSIPWISSSDILENDIQKINISRYITKEAIKNSATKLIPKNTVMLVSRVGIGKFAVAKKNLCTSQDFTNLITTENSYFLVYYFLKLKNRFKQISQGTSIKGFTGKDIKFFKLHLPSLPEQEKIADFLTAVDQRIDLLQQKKDRLESYEKGVMQQIFSPQIRFQKPDGTPYPDWEEKRLGEIAYITTGSSNRQDSILNGKYTFFDRSEDIRTSNIYLFDEEAIIVPGEGSIFTPKHYNGKFDLHQRTYAIMKFKKTYGKFLYFYISFFKNYLLRQAVGSTVKSLRLPMFQKMPILLPTLEEQHKIAGFLSALDMAIDSVNRQIEKMQEWKKGLLQRMFV